MESLLSGKKYTYTEYYALVKDAFAQGKVTGNEQTPERLEATKLNIHRLERIYKTTQLSENLLSVLERLATPMRWVLISEGWCGDSAQLTPVIARLAEASPHITLHIVLRDENEAYMNAYLTNGGKAIPKLIAYQADTEKELFTWGPRPENIQAMVKKLKAEQPDISHEAFVENLHAWYAKDRTASIQQDFYRILCEYA